MSDLGKSRTGTHLRMALRILLLAAGMAVLLAAAPLPASKSLTVGDFAVLIASHLGQGEPSNSARTPEAAVARLQEAGIKLRQNLGASVTEGDAAELFGQFGISLESENPGNLLPRDRAVSLVGIFSASLASKVGSASSGELQSIRADAKSSPRLQLGALESITECQALPKTQDCTQCCRDMLGGSQSEFHTNRICGKACNAKARNASASQPTP